MIYTSIFHDHTVLKLLFCSLFSQMMEGKELRLKQEYFLCSASLQDIVRRYKVFKHKSGGKTRDTFNEFADKVREQHRLDVL